MKKQNRKRIVIFAIIAIFIVGAIAGVYANTVQSDADGQTTANTPVQQLWDNVTDALTGQKLSKFDQMVRVIERTVTEPEKFNELIYDYKYLEKAYHLTQEQMDYIAACVIDGYNMADILKAAFFWVNTNEDISILPQMCTAYPEQDMRDTSNWAEAAFHKVTNYRHGVLEESEMYDYMEQGITNEDLWYAEKLSLRGDSSLTQILDQILEGETYLQITEKVLWENSSPIRRLDSEKQSAAVLEIADKIMRFSGKSSIDETIISADEDELLEQYEQIQMDLCEEILLEMKSENLYRDMTGENTVGISKKEGDQG